ncbi:MAG: HEAT repeat domain-containing protein [Planctomycetes bacterium]|nr:HEAT repeat domain-containing protein [Planctomycetota bacterium]
MFRRCRLSRIIPAIGLAALVLSGCGDNGWHRKKDLPPEPEPRPLAAPDAVLGDTIGAHTLVGAGEPLHLRGFGLVIGLGENGGSDCPSSIREYLLDYLTREFASPDPGKRKPDFSPQQMIDSLDTAVVAVHGLILAGAPLGTPFDLQVQAIGTQTRSLEGGVLTLCELKRFDVASAGRGLVAGRSLARAHGLVFTGPFKGADPSAAQQTARRGYVLGGGRTLLDRTVRLLLQEPSYWMARKIERRINERFGQNPSVAKAMSKGYLTLTTPARYADEPARFIELVTHLYLENAPGLVERKLGELSRQLDGPAPTLSHISLVWEGMGRTVIPHIQPLYTHADPAVRFYAARAGLRLKDVNALAPMERIAESPEHACRLRAVRELGECDYPQAGRQLVRLLDSDDHEVRVAAYEGLLKHKHPAVKTHHFSSALDPTRFNLTLDVVESNARPLVYVRRTLEPRIAVFGPRMPLSLPLFYNHPDDWVTLNALEKHGDIAVLCRTRSGHLMTEPLMVPARVVELIRALADLPVEDDDGRLRGIGLGYARVVEVLDALCTSGAIPAQLAVQTTSGADLLGPAELPERPEGDELPLLTDEQQENSERDYPKPEGEPDRQRPE